MFAVIYREYLLPGKETEYRKAWRAVAGYFVKRRGALGSALHRGADGLWVAYSRWPDKKTRDASWPGENAPSDELPEEIRKAILILKGCLDPERPIPEMCLDIVDEIRSGG